MRQQKIMELLREAAELGQISKAGKLSSKQLGRIMRIQIELCDARYHHRGKEALGYNSAIDCIISSLYVDAIDNCPEALPQLFPAFAALCGDRETGVWITKADWSIAKAPEPAAT